MIVLFTDFGLTGPYTGQVKAVLARRAPGVPVVDLFADAPAFDPKLAAYLLAAYAPAFEPGDVLLCVVDPGVGGDRAALAVEADGRWYVGPDNGLFELVLRRSGSWRCRRIDWRPERLSASFHGRDLFAPVAAGLALGGQPPPGPEAPPARHPEWPDDLPAVVYVDGYGNALTGLRAAALPEGAALDVGGGRPLLRRARTFSDRPEGAAFWYGNANGLAEIAVNRGRAADLLDLRPGSPVAPVAAGPAG